MGNINKICSKIAYEINYGFITYSIEGKTIKITAIYDNYILTIQISPNDEISIYTLNTVESYATSSIWKDILKFGAVIESISEVFKPLHLSKFRII